MYKIKFSRSAEKEIASLPNAVLKRVAKAIDGLEKNPRPNGCKKLKGSAENLWRIRIGDYRVVYSIEDVLLIVDIRKVGHRKDIYD
jgi:mRNA interferase RelE/StbE